MGAVNHGTQTISYTYYEEITQANRGKRNVGIIPRGIYYGGYLTKVTNSEIILSAMVAEIGDNDLQVKVKTVGNAVLNSTTLDSGDISSSTPYIVLRYAYHASEINYMEIHAINSLASAQANDIVVGKCIFGGDVTFDYSERTFLNVQDLFFKVESTGATEMYVRLRAGRIQNSIGYVFVPEQKVGPFNIPSSPLSRIDLVYIDTDGTAKILPGAAASSPVAPNYSGKLVVAQVRLVNGDNNIQSNRISDVRSFITSQTSGGGGGGGGITIKAQVNFAGSGSNGGCIINDSLNVQSVNRQASGVYRVTFINPMSNIYYSFAGFTRGTAGALGGVIVGLGENGLKTTSYVDITCNENNALVNPKEIAVTFFN